MDIDLRTNVLDPVPVQFNSVPGVPIINILMTMSFLRNVPFSSGVQNKRHKAKLQLPEKRNIPLSILIVRGIIFGVPKPNQELL